MIERGTVMDAAREHAQGQSQVRPQSAFARKEPLSIKIVLADFLALFRRQPRDQTGGK